MALHARKTSAEHYPLGTCSKEQRHGLLALPLATPKMAASKSDVAVKEHSKDGGSALKNLHHELQGVQTSTQHDDTDMLRLGKKQELTRNFRFVSTLGFSSVFSCTWEYVLLSTSTALINGGFSGAIYQYICDGWPGELWCLGESRRDLR